jgi:erythritol transport system ATP-binding protein
VLEVTNLSLPRVGGGFTLENVSLDLRRGEILAIFGLMGAGRTELFECLMGLHPEASGEILLNGRRLQNETVRERIELGVMLVPEDRQRLGLVQKLSVAQNINGFAERLFADETSAHINQIGVAFGPRAAAYALQSGVRAQPVETQ